MPRVILYVGAVLVALTFVPVSLLLLSRATSSTSPRFQLVPDMDQQPRYQAQGVNHLFADGRAMRPHVAGTLARGELEAEPIFATGRQGQEFAARNPLPASAAAMARGQERYVVFCSACHGLAGAGDGLVSRRADRLQEGTWTPPTDLASDPVRARPDGHLFNTITSGIRNMPPYGSQIPPADRWAIVAYVRALQRARHATLQDVPPEARDRLQ